MSERLDQLRAQLREDPSSRLFFQLGETLRKEGELEEAAQVLRTGLESYPRYVGAWVSLGRALYELSSVAEAEQAFAQALELDPENPVASRMMGETAMGLGDWQRAIEALKLARVFSPKDEELEERIAFVEERLAEQGQAEDVQVIPPVAAEELSVHQAVTEQFELPSVPDPVSSPETGDDAGVFAVSADDPFADSVASGDTGDFKLGHDVFGAENEAPAPAIAPAPTPVGADQGSKPETEDSEEISADPAAQESSADAVPMATLTLARLALDQGDPDLARRTLEELLEREPGNRDAARLYGELDGELEPVVDEKAIANPLTLREAKVAALQAWLNAVRLAAEVR